VAVACAVIGVIWSSNGAAVERITTAVQVSSGDVHSCAVLTNRHLKCWGDNSAGQIGDGTTTERDTPVTVKRIANAVMVAAGYAHTCALLVGGRIECWGENAYGELGDGTTVERKTPVRVAGIDKAVMVAAGYQDTCALLASGVVKCWGYNLIGELGDGIVAGPDRCGSSACSWKPVAVRGITRATWVSVGGYHACATLVNGTAKCWGDGLDGQLGDGSATSRPAPVRVKTIAGAKEVAASAFNTCALLASGRVECWGANGDGELGHGTTAGPQRCARLRDPCSRTPVEVVGLNNVQQISAGGDTQEGVDHVCALRADATVRCWGYGYEGELGNGDSHNSSRPVPASGVGEATDVAAGGLDSCAVLRTGAIKCWGDNTAGELGIAAPTGVRTRPVAVKGVVAATSVISGGYHSCAVVAGGKVDCWGDNDNGEIGNGITAGGDVVTATAVRGLGNATDGAAGDYHSCALMHGGTVRCWGDNSEGELGIGSTDGPQSCGGDPCSSVPVTVKTITDARQIAAGFFDSCALLSGGGVDCWGDNTYGQLGDGTTTLRSVPAAVNGVATATEIVVGEGHACALVGTGSVGCWGDNASGELGNGTTTSSTTPVPVTGIATATEIAAGGLHSCALLAGGSVECWGDNRYGALGNGTTTSSAVPVAVEGINDAVQITASYGNTCALLAGGSVECWGYNDDGELGNGVAHGPQICGVDDDVCSTRPVTALAITATQISSGGNSACARLSSGSLRCWGANYDGELGDGTASYSLVPVLGHTAVAVPVSGVVSIELPAGKTKTRQDGLEQRATGAAVSTRFQRLTSVRQIPVGSKVDARTGTVRLITATGVAHQTQSGVFGGGAFTVEQSKNKQQKGLTTLTLLTGVLKGSVGYQACKSTRAVANAALSRRALQTLHASARGSFRTRGRYSAGTVRGTVWDTVERCDGTLTFVHSGTVLVTNLVTHKSIAVHAGQRYLARAP
jgi:alpha-tubulin suppressor-like RCC1 family protein